MNLMLKKKAAKIKVLMIGASPDDARYIRDMFAQIASVSFSLEWMNRFDGALGRIERGGVDLILLDISLADAEGFNAFIAAREKAPEVPIVVIAGAADETLAIEAVQSGAQDYLLKGMLDMKLLERTMSHAIERQKYVVEQEKNRRQEILAKERLFHEISREMHSPLTQINQLINGLMGGDITHQERAYLELALENVKRLGSVVSGIMEQHPGIPDKVEINPQRASVAEIASGVLRASHPVADLKGIKISSCIPDNLPPAYCDIGTVKTVLFNLIEILSGRSLAAGSVQLRAEHHDDDPDYICFSIVSALDAGLADAGIGEGGFSRSLEACAELILRQGGRLWQDNENSTGSLVCFTLPVFSISRLLSPLITKNSRLWESIALVTVRLASSSKTNQPLVGETIQREMRNILCYCIRTEDIILPNLSIKDGEESYHVVARADRNGAQSLADRLQNQLRQSDILRGSEVACDVSFAVIDVPKSVGNKPVAEGARQITSKIESLIKHQSERKRAVA